MSDDQNIEKLNAPPVILENERRLLVRRVHELKPYMPDFDMQLPEFAATLKKAQLT